VATAVAAAIHRWRYDSYHFAACSDLQPNTLEFEIMKRSFAGAPLS
jgi:predicted ester cyclase